MNLSPPPHGAIKQLQTKFLEKGLRMYIEVFCFNLVFKKFSYQKGVVNGLTALVGQLSENDVL